jgi:hypothetical protein
MRRFIIKLVVLGGILALALGMLCLAHGGDESGTELPSTVREHVESPDRMNIYTEPRTFRPPQDLALYGLIMIAALALILPLLSRAVTQPANVTIVPLADPYTCVEDASRQVKQSTQDLMALGFLQVLDFTIPELPNRGFYRLMSTPNGHHTVLVVEAETQPRTSKKKEKEYLNFIEFQTLLDNGCRVNTSNNPMRNPLTPPPHFLVTQHPRVATPAALFDVHRRDLDKMRSERGGRIWKQSLETFNDDFTAEWTDIMRYQAALGLLKPGKDGKTYHGRTALLLRAIAPPLTDRPRPWLAVPVPLAGALLTAFIVWCVPKLTALTGLQSHPVAVKELEAYLVLIPAVLAGYLVGMGGALLGALCYAPTLVLFNAGPVDHAALMLLALTAGSVGEKARYWPVQAHPRFFKYFSPEIYVAVALLILVGL